MKILRRNIEIRASQDEDSRLIEGQAIVFDSWSRDLGGFEEIIRSSAISQDLIDSSDVIANVNHDDNQMVARWNRGKGTLRLDLREDGLYFSYEAPKTARGDELLWNIRNGNLFECSFAFSLPNDNTCERWYRDEAGKLKREITKIGGLYDVSVVTVAAYPATSVDARAKELGFEDEIIDVEKINRSIDEEIEAAEQMEKELRTKEIHDKLDEKLRDFYKYISLKNE